MKATPTIAKLGTNAAVASAIINELAVAAKNPVKAHKLVMKETTIVTKKPLIVMKVAPAVISA